MGRAALAGLALSLAGTAGAEWAFTEPLTVAEGATAQVFHHLESSGRRSMAVQEGQVALVWEDNSGRRLQVFVSIQAGDGTFSVPRVVSGRDDAYEPAVAAAGAGRFVVAWEEAGGVWLRLVEATGIGPARRADAATGAQVTLAGEADGRIYAAWARTVGPHPQVVVAPVAVEGAEVRVGAAVAADPQAPQDAQLYPALAVTGRGITVAWEDRRHGHTRLLYRHADHGLRFEESLRELNERPPSQSDAFGRGSGVTRVALAAGAGRVAAVWMDKRDFRGGYGVYAALSEDGGRSFGPNEKVQDPFGDNVPQWHPAIAAGVAGEVAAAWDDSRDDPADVWLSWRVGVGEWSDDLALPGAHGPGTQSHPVLAFDPHGRLHAAWVERSGEGISRVRYALGTRAPND